MRAAAIQMCSGLSPGPNLDEAEKLIREAAANGATLISTPEMTTAVDQDRQRLLAKLSSGRDPEDRFTALSAELGVLLHMGSMAVPAGEGKLRNHAVLIDDGRILARYDKVHLFDVDLDTGESWRESRAYVGGDEAVLAKTRGTAIGLSICFDLRFPALYRALAKAGAEILAVPAAFTVPTGKAHWHALLRARAIENGAFVIAAAQGGQHEDGRVTYGHSMIVGPWGEVLDELPHDEPGIAYADLDFERVRDARARVPVLQLERDVPVRILGV